MAKITISQLHTVDTGFIQELTNAEIDTTKGGLLPLTSEFINSTFESLQKYIDELQKSVGVA